MELKLKTDTEDDQEYFESLCTMVTDLSDDLKELDLNKRSCCSYCNRPITVCLCPFMSKQIELKLNVKIWILQHPCEEKRCLRTCVILDKLLKEQNFQILKGRRFSVDKYPQLESVYSNPNSVVLYPSEESIPIDEYQKIILQKRQNNDQSDANELYHHVIIIDGTWPQASGIYHTNEELRRLKQVKHFNSHFFQ
jgi:DTW domain-containing protein YfiP